VGSPGIVFGAILISLSAMTYWASTYQRIGTRHPPVRIIRSLGGGVDIQLSAFVFSMSRSSEHTHHALTRQVIVSNGGFRTSSPRDVTSDDEGAVVRDRLSPAPHTPGAGDERSS
jgi:hypothetical protein